MSHAVRAAAATVAAAALAAATPAGGDARAQEGPEGMPPGPGREEVFYLCSACHSIRLVQQQGLSRERWDKLLTWMVEAQGMAELPDGERGLVLDYLAEHYGPDRTRRPPTPGGGFGPLTPLPGAGGGF